MFQAKGVGDMSLRFVIGRSGSGKTTTILNEIREKLIGKPEGDPVLYIVPDQMTFLSEYQLVNSQELSGMIRTQVFSFTRLAWRVLQETGGVSRQHISSTGLNMLIRKIIEDHKDELTLFKKASDKTGFIQHVETMLTEFKHYCIKPKELKEKQEQLVFGASTRVLADKLHDLELVYSKFEQALVGKYIGSDDYLHLLANSISESNYLKNAEIYIDGFQNFTPQEYLVIGELMKTCKRVSIALMLDRPFKFGTRPDDLYLFRMTGDTYSILFEMARTNEIEIEDDVYLADSPKFEDKSLQHLQSQFEKRPSKPYNEKPAIALKIATNRRAEIESIAREIRKLVMESGYRYQDIAVLIRNGQDYQETLQTVFRDYDIPFFHDQKRTMLNHPFIEFIRSSLEAISSHWRYEPIFRVVKTELLFPSESKPELIRERMDRLENYVLSHGVKGEQWTNKRRWPYKRYVGLEMERVVQTDAERKMEDEINDSRDLVIQPLLKLSKRLKGAQTGRGLCEAVYRFIEEHDIPSKLEDKSFAAEEKGQLVSAREYDQAWNTVIGLLDEFVEVLGDQKISLPKFIAILDSGLEAAKFSLIPPALDQVFIADMEQSRLYGIRVAFVVGLNDGVLPKAHGDEGILSDEDRDALVNVGIEVAPSGKKKLLDEDFVAYRAFTTPQSRLYISYPLANDEGKAMLPSPYVKRIKDIFQEIEENYEVNDPGELAEEEQFAYISHPTTAIAYLSAQLQLKKRHYPIPDFWWDVFNYYMDNPQLKRKATRILSSLYYRNEVVQLSETTSQDLYGKEILASVSRMEMFHGCPFSHFSSHGLKLHERDVFKLEAPHIGDLFHAALKWIADAIEREGLSWANLTERECERFAREAVKQLAPKLFNQILLSSNRYIYIMRKLERIITRASLILGTQSKLSGFKPVGLELTFGPAKELPPLSFTLKNGTKMQLQGRIDRVDKAEDNDNIYLRIIDYKSSSREIDLNEVYYGLSLQMLTYLDIVLTHSVKLIGKNALPAGVLYFHVHNPMINGDDITTIEDVEKELLKKFKMKGLLLGNSQVIQLMDSSLTTGSSDIVPAGLKKDGNLTARSNAASREDFGALQNYVRNLYQQSGDRIVSGEVEIAPYRLADRTPCQFCPFKPVCQFDQNLGGNDYREIPKWPLDDVLEKMKGVEIDHENSDSNKA